ncbi:HAMP domain-containing sensor histidine kinase [Caenispirillum bisanense]|uniref:sensor histidine kinase n=1 Tax=Caenispirillum bisanense TaxID=414052 RepID=UPI0031E1E6D6
MTESASDSQSAGPSSGAADLDLAAGIIDALPASGCLVDEQGCILAVSADWRRFGAENGSLDTAFGRGSNYVTLCAASSDAAIRAIGRGVAQVLAGEREEFRHVYSCHAPWEVRWFRVICRPVTTAGRRLAMVLHTSVTGEVLQGSLLREADREARRAGRERAEVLQRLSEELRSPLNTIIGLADMLSQAVFGPLGNPRYQDYSREISAGGRRLRRLIDDVVELSLLEGGGLDLADDDVAVGPACEAVAAEVAEEAASRRVEVSTRVPESLPLLRADGARLRQMLRALLDNALSVSPEDSVVTVEAGEDAAGCLTITVSDQGPGLRRTEQGRIGDTLTAGPGAALEAGPTGLGLALTKGLMDAHGGRLMLRARPGRGTATTLRFPNTRTLAAAADAVD